MTVESRNGLDFFEPGSGNPASYSAAVRAGELIYTAGQIGAVVGGEPADFLTQANEALRRVIAAVEAAGGGIETIVKVNGYLADLDDFPIYDQLYRSVIDIYPKPARTTVQIARLPEPLLVEIDAVALTRAGARR